MLLVLVPMGLGGCASQQETYCATLKDDQKQLRTLTARTGEPGATGATAMRDTTRLLSRLRDEAPDDIHGDWVTLVDAFAGLRAAIKASGATPGDFAGGKRPRGVTDGQVQAVRQAAAELGATPVQQAGKSIEQHAQDVCKVDLGSELGGAGQ